MQVLDARNLPFQDGLFDLVVDKGTVDAMLCDKAGKGSARYASEQRRANSDSHDYYVGDI